MASTLDRMMQKPSFKKAFDDEYKELVVSELICEMMAEGDSSAVYKLAKALNLSPTAIQNLRSGVQEDL